MIQKEREFAQLLELFIERKPKSVLELGCGYGGTLWSWAHNSDKAWIVAVSLFKGGGVPNILPDISKWNCDTSSLITPIDGRTDDPYCIELARVGGPYDWLFIDADHTYKAAKFDWETYSPMVTPGGVVVFHDIGVYPSEENHFIEVRLLFDELAKTHKTKTFIDDPNDPSHCFGIGVVYKE